MTFRSHKDFAYGVLPSVRPFRMSSAIDVIFYSVPDRQIRLNGPQPRVRTLRLSHVLGLASSAFVRHYLRNHCCFLFLWVLRCFTSHVPSSCPMCSGRVTGHDSSRVSPFGNPRSQLGWQLPEAYRSLPYVLHRLGTKASTVRPYNWPQRCRVHCAVSRLRRGPAAHPTRFHW